MGCAVAGDTRVLLDCGYNKKLKAEKISGKKSLCQQMEMVGEVVEVAQYVSYLPTEVLARKMKFRITHHT
jgi:hypothetical protein